MRRKILACAVGSGVAALGLASGRAQAANAACNPLTYGAVGNGVIDNTAAI